MNRGIRWGDVSMFGPESGPKCVFCKKFVGGITFLKEMDGNLQNHIPMREKRMSTGENNFLI
jgi:hypothetical protein